MSARVKNSNEMEDVLMFVNFRTYFVDSIFVDIIIQQQVQI